METPNPPSSILLLLPLLALVSGFSDHASGRLIGGRRILNFKEDPHGNNVTFDCSPSGPCVACQFSEKNDDNYRCSETGYRIRFQCLEIEAGSQVLEDKNSEKGRGTLEVSPYSDQRVVLHDVEHLVASVGGRALLDDDSSSSKGGLQGYITYQSCMPAVNDQKLSVVGFEGIMLFMLMVSGTVIYFRKFNTAASGAPMRIPTSFRF